jgi:hypothetical protein
MPSADPRTRSTFGGASALLLGVLGVVALGLGAREPAPAAAAPPFPAALLGFADGALPAQGPLALRTLLQVSRERQDAGWPSLDSLVGDAGVRLCHLAGTKAGLELSIEQQTPRLPPAQEAAAVRAMLGKLRGGALQALPQARLSRALGPPVPASERERRAID